MDNEHIQNLTLDQNLLFPKLSFSVLGQFIIP